MNSNIFSPVVHRYSLALNEILADNPTILDVGGYRSRSEIIKNKFKNYNYISVNVGSAWYENVSCDFVYDGLHLPFSDNSYEYIISVDSLEHINKDSRFKIIREMYRVAKSKVIIVSPFQMLGIPTYESHILKLCNLYNVNPPPSLVEHEFYGLPFLSEIDEYVKSLGGKFKFATFKKDYWELQTAMLWNTISLNGKSEEINRKLQKTQEDFLSKQPYPSSASDSYRVIMIFEK